jgi:hypothetical protein
MSYASVLKAEALPTTVRNDGPGENLRSKHVLVSAALHPITTNVCVDILLHHSTIYVRTATPRQQRHGSSNQHQDMVYTWGHPSCLFDTATCMARNKPNNSHVTVWSAIKYTPVCLSPSEPSRGSAELASCPHGRWQRRQPAAKQQCCCTPHHETSCYQAGGCSLAHDCTVRQAHVPESVHVWLCNNTSKLLSQTVAAS